MLTCNIIAIYKEYNDFNLSQVQEGIKAIDKNREQLRFEPRNLFL